jgi:UDP-N-acetyl-D-mannosaminuronate dehydrogenase
MEGLTDLLPAVRAADCAVIITNHSSFNYPEILENCALIVDTRNALREIGHGSAKVWKL